MKIEFSPVGVCPNKIEFEIEDGKLHNVKFHGGCPGNLLAIPKLIEGADAASVAKTLRGNPCRDKGTSCADQLAIAIDEALAKAS